MKRRRTRGGLTKTNKVPVIETLDRQAPEGCFRVSGISVDSGDVWVEGTFNDFTIAKTFVDKKGFHGVTYYVHNDSNRVLYSNGG